jgi:hypothetical protein
MLTSRQWLRINNSDGGSKQAINGDEFASFVNAIAPDDCRPVHRHCGRVSGDQEIRFACVGTRE